MFDDNIIHAQAVMGKMKGLENGAFFNEDDQESNQSSGDSQEDEEEDGEFNPHLHAQVLVDGDEY